MPVGTTMDTFAAAASTEQGRARAQRRWDLVVGVRHTDVGRDRVAAPTGR